MVQIMLRFIRELRSRRSAEAIDTATSLWERFMPSPREIVLLVVGLVSTGGLAWWGAIQAALPFGLGLGVVLAIAWRSAWLSERARGLLAREVNAPFVVSLPAADDPHYINREMQPTTEDRVDSLQKEIVDLRNEIHGIFQARDAGVTLRILDRQANDLFDKLFYGADNKYFKAEIWRADYNNWKNYITRFWDLMRTYSDSVEQPFALKDSDFDGKDGIPGNDLFLKDEIRILYQIMLLVNERHMKFKESAFALIAEKGTPPTTPI